MARPGSGVTCAPVKPIFLPHISEFFNCQPILRRVP
jgi:hypothetical protein